MAIPDRRLEGFLRHHGLTRITHDAAIHPRLFDHVLTAYPRGGWPATMVMPTLAETAVASGVLDLSRAGPAAARTLRKFATTLQEATPALVDPSRRKAVIDAALDLAEGLSAALIEFLHGVVRSAADTLKSTE